MWKYFVFCGNLDFFIRFPQRIGIFGVIYCGNLDFFLRFPQRMGVEWLFCGVLWRNKKVVKGYLRLYFVGVNVVGDAKCGYHSQVDCLLIVGYGVEYVFFAA